MFSRVTFLCFLCLPIRISCQGLCYSSSEVAGISIAVFLVTLVLIGLGCAVIWYKRKEIKDFYYNSRTERRRETLAGPKPNGKDKFAFDNPYFREEDTVEVVNALDGAEKGQINGTKTVLGNHSNHGSSNGKVNGVPVNNPISTVSKQKKNLLGNPFTSIFSQAKKQQRTMDDSCIDSVEPERVLVPLRGHDFTGLGFNICGNMRDGIFVKDVLHRGPASESGKIKAGDRILGVTVSFTKMVYEDALTILSYASPYDVHLELEKTADHNKLNPAGLPVVNGGALLSSQGKQKLGSSTSFSTGGQRLFHPLYRSQSIDDLTQIGKDGGQKGAENKCNTSPQRSKSVGLSVLHQRSKSNVSKASDGAEDEIRTKTSNKPIGIPVTGSLNERMLANAISEDTLAKEALGSLSEHKETGSADTEKHKVAARLSLGDTEKKTLSARHTLADTEKRSVAARTTLEKTISQMEEVSKETLEPSSLPRKNVTTPAKRKAPPPPPELASLTPSIVMETKAQIHCSEEKLVNRRLDSSSSEDEKDSVDGTRVDRLGKDLDVDSLELCPSPPPLINGLKRRVSVVSNDSLELEGPVTRNDLEVTGEEVKGKKDKSSSLGELDKLSEAANHLSSSMVLERAVSLDLKDQQPQENHLGSQKLHLSPPGGAAVDYQLIASTPLNHRTTIMTSDPNVSQVRPIREEPKKPARKGKEMAPSTPSKSGLSGELPSSTLVFDFEDDDLEENQKVDSKEVIEIRPDELDDVMMSHRQFLLKQAKETGVYSGLNPDPTIKANLNFEPWSFVDRSHNLSTSVNGEGSHYKTAVDYNPWSSMEFTSVSQNLSKIVKTDVPSLKVFQEQGTVTRTLLVDPRIKTETDSPLPRLQPP